MPQLAIGIAGAGPAGLMAAACLRRDGHRVEVFERFETPRPIGAGLMLQPTGLACLARLGLDRPAIAAGAVITGIDGRTISGGRIFDVRYAVAGGRLFGLGIHRGTLFALLYEAAQALGVPIAASAEIVRTTRDGRGRRLVDSQGRRHGPFDLVIDATGMRSPLRALEGEVRNNRPYAYGALWTIVPMPADWPYPQILAQVYRGAQKMAGVLPVGRRPGEATPLAALFWSLRTRDYETWREGGLEAWKAEVLAYWPVLAPFLVHVTTTQQLTLASYADMTLRRRVADRLVFIGDAGRTTSPQLGQGCNLGLIDATLLAQALKDATAETVNAALAAYATARRAHSGFYSVASRWLTPFFQSDSALAGGIRDAVFPLMGRVPYLQREMVRTLAGMKTGLFSHLDPGQWHPEYALAAMPAPTRVPV